MRWRLWVRLHFVVTGLGLMGHSVATPRNPQRPFPHTDIAFMVCASLHDKLWFAISARGVVGSLLPLRLPNVMLMPVSKKGTALDKGECRWHGGAIASPSNFSMSSPVCPHEAVDLETLQTHVVGHVPTGQHVLHQYLIAAQQ